MTLNLLRDPWLRVSRRSGRVDVIAPHDVTSLPDDPVVDIISPRPDLRASLHHFLIGLLQTAHEPTTEPEWRTSYHGPPAPADLLRRFEAIAGAFDLDGGSMPFAQERALSGESKPISHLLFGMPSGNTLKLNKDLFVKRRSGDALCPMCAAAALYGLQNQAQKGGRGHRTALRGGGPLSTLIDAPTLWERLWLNVLPKSHWQPEIPRGNGPRTFPWLASRDMWDKKVSMDCVDAGHHFWATPRRLLLQWADNGTRCSLCGTESRRVARSLVRATNGIDYGGSWDHPLSPTYEKDALRLCVKGSSSSAAYRHWRGLLYAQTASGRFPAPVVSHLWSVRARGLERWTWALWVHGFETDDASVLGWYEHRIPSILVPDEEQRAAYEADLERLISAAELAQYYVRRAMSDALGERAPDPGPEFWARTQDAFQSAARDVLLGDAAEARRAWREYLRRETHALFARMLPIARIADDRPGRVARAEQQLKKNLAGPKLLKALALEAATTEVRA